MIAPGKEKNMVWLVEFEAEGIKGQYTVSCRRISEAQRYTAEDIAEQIGTTPEKVIITSIERAQEPKKALPGEAEYNRIRDWENARRQLLKDGRTTEAERIWEGAPDRLFSIPEFPATQEEATAAAGYARFLGEVAYREFQTICRGWAHV